MKNLKSWIVKLAVVAVLSVGVNLAADTVNAAPQPEYNPTPIAPADAWDDFDDFIKKVQKCACWPVP